MRVLVALLLALTVVVAAPNVEARDARWKKVEVVPKPGRVRVLKRLTRLLKKATKKEDWGKGETVWLTARLTKLVWEKKGDVLRVSVTVVAKIVDGKGARSHIRIGGRPKDKLKLEKQALKIVSEGLITRLSDMARSQPPPKKKKSDEGD